MNRLRRIADAAGVLAGLVVVLVAMPAVVWVGVGWPLPRSLPTWSEVTMVMSTSGISDTELLDGLSVVFWLLWSYLLLNLVVVAVAARRGSRLPRLPLAGPLQALAAEVVAILVLGLSSLSARSSGDIPVVLPLLSAAIPVDHQAAGLAGHAVGSNAAAAAQLDARQPASAATTPYTVERGDSEWTIAGHKFGDPRRWPAIWEENEGREEPGGRRFTNPSLILPGWKLDIPDLGRQAIQAPTSPQPGPTTSAATPSIAPAPAPPTRPEAVDPPATLPTAPALAPSSGRLPTSASPHPAASTPQSTSSARIVLPLGGAIGLSLAAAITAAVTTARRHEWRRWRPGDVFKSQVDTYLMTPSVNAARRAVHRASRSLDGDDTDGAALLTPPPILHQLFEDMPGRTPVATTATPTLEELSVDIADLADVALTGAGAAPAARALVVGVLAHHKPHRAEVMVVGSAAELLPGIGEVPGATVIGDVAEAAGAVDDEFARRSRVLHRRQLDDYRETAGSHDPFDVLFVLVASADLPIRPATLDAAARVGGRLGIAVLSVGALDGFRSVEVGADGTVSEPVGSVAPGGRLHVLTDREAEEYLGALAASRGAGVVSAESIAAARADHQLAPAPPEAPKPDPGVMPRPVELRLFGRPQVFAAGAEVRTGLRRRARSLLVLLAVSADGVSPEKALADVWHEAGDDDADTKYVYTVASNTRARLRELVGRRVEVIASGAECYELDPNDVDVDLWRFEAAVADAAAAPDIESRARALQRAAAEVRGEPLEGVDYEWAESVRERIRRRAIDALTGLSDLVSSAGDVDGAIELIERALQLDSASEDLYRRLMALQASTGRGDAARRAYRQCALELKDLGVEPDDATQAIAEAAPSPPDVWSPDLPAEGDPGDGNGRVHGGVRP